MNKNYDEDTIHSTIKLICSKLVNKRLLSNEDLKIVDSEYIKKDSGYRFVISTDKDHIICEFYPVGKIVDIFIARVSKKNQDNNRYNIDMKYDLEKQEFLKNKITYYKDESVIEEEIRYGIYYYDIVNEIGDNNRITIATDKDTFNDIIAYPGEYNFENMDSIISKDRTLIKEIDNGEYVDGLYYFKGKVEYDKKGREKKF